jgi:branched-chain amino acid transport system permease protein
MSDTPATDRARAFFRDAARWRWWEVAIWLAAAASWFLLPRHLLLINDIAIFALFALSLDLILGYAGIVSLGHVAFFGVGAYVAGLLALHGWSEPLSGLLIAGLAAGVVGLVTSPLILRGSDLTRLMITLGVAAILHQIANSASDLTGGSDGLQGIVVDPILGVFRFDLFGRTAAAYSLIVLFALFLLARLVMSAPFGLSLRAIRVNRLRAGAVGIATHARLVAVYTLAAVYAGIAGALLCQTTQFVSLDFLDFHRSADVMIALIIGGGGWLYGGLIGAVVFRELQDFLSDLTPQYWEFWIGLMLVAIVLIGRERFASFGRLLSRRRRAEASP